MTDWHKEGQARLEGVMVAVLGNCIEGVARAMRNALTRAARPGHDPHCRDLSCCTLTT